MAHADEIPSNYVNAISKQVHQLISEGLDEELVQVVKDCADPTSPKSSVTLGDSLQIWTLDNKGIEGFTQRGLDLDKIARSTGQRGHLLRVNTEGKSFIRSTLTKDGSAPMVGQLQTSYLARSIASAIDLVERETASNAGFRERVGDDPLVRLLSAPFFRVSALWLINEARKENYVIVVESLTKSIKLRTRELLTSQEFLKAFPLKQKTFSIS